MFCAWRPLTPTVTKNEHSSVLACSPAKHPPPAAQLTTVFFNIVIKWCFGQKSNMQTLWNVRVCPLCGSADQQSFVILRNTNWLPLTLRSNRHYEINTHIYPLLSKEWGQNLIIYVQDEQLRCFDEWMEGKALEGKALKIRIRILSEIHN